ncbi:hypothetical protein HPP92_010703 [Vanilla planifolia]|uniref:Uncharacterized protein n=1 Tax=Vanilla planifolia TaxID=51239 RepID=A0A835V0C0_VANPL|nr:hypothetical protein HPP92_010703 [Vanilla planifolia]
MEGVEPQTPLAGDDFDSTISKLRASHASISSVLCSSIAAARNLAATAGLLSCQQEFVSGISAAIAPLQSQSLANKALHARINNAVIPSFSLLRALSRADRLERHLLTISSARNERRTGSQTVVYVESVGRLSAAVAAVTAECEPAVQKLQEAVEFLGRTKATDKLRVRRLRDAAAALRAVCGKEIERMRYEGPLDDALIRLQDEYENILRRLRHADVGDLAAQGEEDGAGRLGQGMDDPDWPTLGSVEDIEILHRVSETLASNDCLDICIDIFVKVIGQLC